MLYYSICYIITYIMSYHVILYYITEPGHGEGGDAPRHRLAEGAPWIIAIIAMNNSNNSNEYCNNSNKRELMNNRPRSYIVAIFYPFSQFCEMNISLLSLQTQPNTAPNLFQRGVEYGKYVIGIMIIIRILRLIIMIMIMIMIIMMISNMSMIVIIDW